MSSQRLRPLYRRWLPAVLALAAVANLVVDQFLPSHAQTFRRHHNGTLTHLVHTEQNTLDLRYGIYMELADVLGGDTLVVPEGSPLSDDLARGLANITLEERAYDPTALSGVVPEGEPLGSFRADEETISYWVLSNGGGDRWWLGASPEGIVIVPDTVAPVPGAGP